MTSRRIPLGEVPNAANSPARHVASFKRSRDLAEAHEKFSIDPQPKSKRQAVDLTQAKLRGSPTKIHNVKEESCLTRPPPPSQPTAFEKRLLAARDVSAQERIKRAEKPPQETLDGVRRWQHHYKKAFPQFVFYFESVPEEARIKYSRTVRNLGAREEKFFSRDVTHVVTTRSMPTATDGRNNPEVTQPTLASANSAQPRTINPSILDKLNGFQNNAAQKGKFNFEGYSRRTDTNGSKETDQKRPVSGTVDVLSRAQNLNMKIWHLEKLQRIMNTIFEVPDDTQTSATQQQQRRTNLNATKAEGGADLSRMLRQERIHGPSDRDASAKVHEIVPFKGPYLYIRDVDERTKPIMVKEWPRPTKLDESGDWPQFRAVGYGKCPFVEDLSKEDIQMIRQERHAEKQRLQSRSRQQSRAPTPQPIFEDDEDAVEQYHNQLNTVCHRALRDVTQSASAHNARPEKTQVAPLGPPPSKLPVQNRSPLKAQMAELKDRSRGDGVEPAASGLQPSNITSAIRSQVISSTAAAPFVRAGTSKEVHGLKRKVLEKNVGPVLHTVQARQPTVDHYANGRAETQISRARQHKLRQPEQLAEIYEETPTPDEEQDVWLEDVRRKQPAENMEKTKKDAKPGYCENCREKYDDFDEHIADRKHRKFALDPNNFKDLDRFLAKLVRHPKAIESEGF